MLQALKVGDLEIADEKEESFGDTTLDELISKDYTKEKFFKYASW